VYRKYLEASADKDGIKIMATGRLNKVPDMRKNIYTILRNNNLEFDEVMKIPKTENIQKMEKVGYILIGAETHSHSRLDYLSS